MGLPYYDKWKTKKELSSEVLYERNRHKDLRKTTSVLFSEDIQG